MVKVLCGIITNSEGEIFLARRKPGKSLAGKWEFPGGKLEEGESEPECLKRELLEELGMEVIVHERVGENVHQYPTFQIRLIGYRCELVTATYALTDHDEYAWVKPEEILLYDLAEADVPLVAYLV
jgi:8-oxo-dGTP diphosphatase